MIRSGLLIGLLILVVVAIWSDLCSGASPLESLIPTREDIPTGWTSIEGPRVYTKKTLFEHIDGQAELFFKYGFQKSVFAIYQNKKNPNHQIELDIYDMGNVLQAFGIFSRFRNEDRPIGIGLDSFLDDGSALFYKGKYFVMLYSTESNPSILKQWAAKIALKIVDTSAPPKEVGYFPKDGLKPGSIQYFPEGLLGYQFLKRGFQGTYIEKDEDEDKAKVQVEVKAEAKVKDGDETKTEIKEFHLFLAIFKDSQGAMGALRAYRHELVKKGKIYPDIPAQFGTHALKGEDPYQGQIIIVPKGSYLLGIVGFEKEESVEDRFKEFMRNTR
jgi:hypothetical protein